MVVSRLLVVAACLMIIGTQATGSSFGGSPNEDCSGTYNYPLTAAANQPISSTCKTGTLALNFWITDDVNRAFQVQVTGGMEGVNQPGVKFIIDQIDIANTKTIFLNCTDAGSSCEAVFKPKSVTTYTYRTMTLNWVQNNTKGVNVTILVSSIPTNMIMTEVAVNSDKAITVMPQLFENTRQIIKLTTQADTKDNSYVSKFTLMPNTNTTCYLDDSTVQLYMLGTNFVDYKCNTTETTFSGTGYLEYTRKQAKFGPAFPGQVMYVGTKKTNSATRSAFSWAAALLVVYQIMLKH